MNVDLIEPRDDRWRRLLEGIPHDVYHLPGYTSLSARTVSAQALGLYAEARGAELLIPLVVRPLPQLGQSALEGWRDATSPYGYACPLVRGVLNPAEWDEFCECVMGELREQEILSCFLRGHPFITSEPALLGRLGLSLPSGETVVLNLDADESAIWDGIRRDHRDRIQRMRRRGYTVEVDEWSHLPGFRAIYAETMRSVKASEFYFFDDAYFAELTSALREHLHLFSVLAPDRSLACAALVTVYRGMVHGHLLGTAPEHRKAAPSNLLYDAVWRWAKARGERFLNLGGGRGGAQDSLFEFKRGFSSLTQQLRTTRIVSEPDLYRSACQAAGVDGGSLAGFFPAYRAASEGAASPPQQSASITDDGLQITA